jgi:hypothetical protein
MRTRTLFAGLTLLAPLTASAQPEVRGDLDVLVGTTTTPDGAYPFAPALGAFVGADFFDLITPGVRFLGVDGATARQGSIRAYSMAAEVRVHSPGDNQFWMSAGAGRGELLQLQCNCDVQTFAGARPGMSLNVAVGFRSFVVRGLGGVGGQITMTRWSNVSRTVPLGPGGGRAPDVVREGNLWGLTVGITLSGRTSGSSDGP